MECPDFIVSKTVPTQHPEARSMHILAVLEIKIDEDDVPDINNSPTVLRALERLVRHAHYLINAEHARVPTEGAFPAYLLYGSMYTSLELHRRGPSRTPLFRVQPWQSIFQKVDLPAGTAPFMYRMCQLAADCWD